MAAPLELTRFVYPISFRQGVACVREPDPNGLPKPRLLDRVRAAVRVRHYSRRTEEAYVAWIRRYIFFHGKRGSGPFPRRECTWTARPANDAAITCTSRSCSAP
jgi:hypothetical protein